MSSYLFVDYFLIAIFALIVGSFASYITYRLGEGQDLLLSYSKCISCEVRLKFYNLVPLFSWYFQRGKCGSCGVKMSLRYPLIELLFLFVFWTIFTVNGQLVNDFLIFLLIFATIFLIIAIIDIEYYFVPISMQILLLLTVMLFKLFYIQEYNLIDYYGFSAMIYSVFAFSLYFLFLVLVKKEAIGIDDIKLFFTVGLLLGIDKFVDFTFICGLLGVFFGLFWQRIKDDRTFPFAPAILTSTFLCFIIGSDNSYLELIIIQIANIMA